MRVIEIFIENHIMHDLDRELLEEAVEMRPVSFLWCPGLKRQDEVLGADLEPSPGAQFARRHRGCDAVGGLLRELERLEARDTRQLERGRKPATAGPTAIDLRDGVEIFGEDYPSPFEDAVIPTMDGITTVSLAAL